jgi:DNA-binding GntR family transcriptional regulator
VGTIRNANAVALQPPDRRTIVEHLVESLREAIIRGRYEPGQELNQSALAKEFGVARIPVREALRQLQGEGLVSSQAHMRVIVTGITPQVALEQIEIRAMIEQYLLARAAPRLTAENFVELHGLCDRMEATTRREPWLALNVEFHRVLLAPARSGFGYDLSRDIARRITQYVDIRVPGGLERIAAGNREHREIVESLERKSVKRAQSLLLAHIHHTRDRVLQLVGPAAPSDALSPRSARPQVPSAGGTAPKRRRTALTQ